MSVFPRVRIEMDSSFSMDLSQLEISQWKAELTEHNYVSHIPRIQELSGEMANHPQVILRVATIDLGSEKELTLYL